MIGGENKIKVQIKYQNIEETFSGSVDDVWISINRFFTESVPTWDISKRILLTVHLQNLIKDCQGIIAVAEEGPYLLVSKDQLTDKETLALQLLASYIGYRLGIMKDDAVSRDKLQEKLGKTSKITSTRLGELVRSEMATKTDDGKFKITTFGVTQLQKDVLPKIKRETSI